MEWALDGQHKLDVNTDGSLTCVLYCPARAEFERLRTDFAHALDKASYNQGIPCQGPPWESTLLCESNGDALSDEFVEGSPLIARAVR